VLVKVTLVEHAVDVEIVGAVEHAAYFGRYVEYAAYAEYADAAAEWSLMLMLMLMELQWFLFAKQ